jgi:hypothetical protein
VSNKKIDTIPITLYPSRLKMAGLSLICALFVAVSILMIIKGDAVGYLVGSFFTLGLVIFGLQFYPKAAYLHLSTDGFTFCSLFRAHFVSWSDVQEFGVISIGLNRMVAWNYYSDYIGVRRARLASQAISGYEAALPDTYGMKPWDLPNTLNSLLHQYK